MQSTKLSKNVITHKLTIKWEWTKYIPEDFAKTIFSQLADPTKKTITIANPEIMLFITKYRSEVQLVPLDNENRSFEDKIQMSWLNIDQRERFRNIWIQRKKENKSISDISFNKLIKAIKEKTI